jgi:hypothetical protein
LIDADSLTVDVVGLVRFSYTQLQIIKTKRAGDPELTSSHSFL